MINSSTSSYPSPPNYSLDDLRNLSYFRQFNGNIYPSPLNRYNFVYLSSEHSVVKTATPLQLFLLSKENPLSFDLPSIPNSETESYNFKLSDYNNLSENLSNRLKNIEKYIQLIEQSNKNYSSNTLQEENLDIID
jgi:hypothetical protein